MARLILVITALLSVGAIVLGIMNRGTFIEVRNEKDGINQQIQAAIDNVDETVDEMKKLHKESDAIEEARDVARIGTEATNENVNSVKRQVADVEKKAEARRSEIASLKSKLEPFEGITLETVNQDVADMEQEIEQLR